MKLTIGLLIAALLAVLTLLSTNRSPAGKLRSAVEARNSNLAEAASLLQP